MQLITANLRRYRSIEDGSEFTVEPDVTCLVGKNESGKTAVLQGLYKSYPVNKAKFDEGLDYPSRLTRERKEEGKLRVTELTYKLDDSELVKVEGQFGPGVLKSRTIEMASGYRYDGVSTWDLQVDEAAAVRHLREGLDLPQATQQLADQAADVRALIQVLEGMEAPTSAVIQVLSKVEDWRDNNLQLAVIDSLAPQRPRFVYFGDYDSMPGKVSIPHLIAARKKGTLTRGEEAVLALLSMAGVDLEDFQEPESHEHLIRDLENASNSISSEVFEYWTQNKNLSVRLDIIGTPEPGATAPFDQAPLLQIRVVNQRHNVSVPFDERSRGFVWFFSFLAYFTHLESESKQLILLLDEPGLNLHATAQADLLRFIDERLAPNHQVLFSTHSPFMINAHKFGRVRTVIDDEKKGTIVSADVLRADAETAFPLHATLGIELSQTLFVGPNVLLVEGPGDLVYLEILSETLKTAGRKGLDERLVITPAGGIAKLPAFIGLLGSNGLNTIALIDSSSNESAMVKRLREAGRVGGGGLVEIGSILGKADADIEDLFEPGFYVELINDAYQGLLSGKKLTVKELPDDPRLVRRVERAFEARGLNQGRINHFSPATALNRRQSHYVPKLNEKTLERAGKLFTVINNLVSQS